MTEVMTVNEVAEKLRLSVSMVYKMAKQGELPSFKVGSRVLFSAEKIDALINGKEVNNETVWKESDSPERNSDVVGRW